MDLVAQCPNLRPRLHCLILGALALVTWSSVYSGSDPTISFAIPELISQGEHRSERNHRLRRVLKISAANGGDDDDDNAQGEAAVLHPLFSHGRSSNASLTMPPREPSRMSSMSLADSFGDVSFSEEMQSKRLKRRAPWQKARDSHRDAFASLEALRLEKLKRRQANLNADDELGNTGSSSSSTSDTSSSSGSDSSTMNSGVNQGYSGRNSGDDSNESSETNEEDIVTEYSTSTFERKKHSGKRSGKVMMRIGKYAKHRKKLRGSSTYTTQSAEAAYSNVPIPLARPLNNVGTGRYGTALFHVQSLSSSSQGTYDMPSDSGVPSILSDSADSIPNGGIGLGGFTSMEFGA